MSLVQQINEDIKAAMKARQKDKLEAVRNIKKILIEAKTAHKSDVELNDQEVFKLIGKLAKQGRDSAKIYSDQNRQDLADEEMVQVMIYESYLPQKMSDGELEAAVKEIIAAAGASGLRDMGKVMGIASGQLGGKAEGKAIADTVKRLLK